MVHGALASSVYYLTIAKYLQENFCGALKNHKSLAQRIFSCLWYVVHTSNLGHSLAYKIC